MIETWHALAILAEYSKGLLFTAATFQLRTLSRSPSSAVEPAPLCMFLVTSRWIIKASQSLHIGKQFVRTISASWGIQHTKIYKVIPSRTLRRVCKVRDGAFIDLVWFLPSSSGCTREALLGEKKVAWFHLFQLMLNDIKCYKTMRWVGKQNCEQLYKVHVQALTFDKTKDRSKMEQRWYESGNSINPSSNIL